MAEKTIFFDRQYREHGAEVLNFIAKHLDNPSTAEDLTQEVFFRAQNTAKWKTIEKPRAYLFTVARNLLNDHYRKLKVQHQDKTLEYDEKTHGGVAPSEEKRLEARDELRTLGAAINSLPPRGRRAFMLNRVYRYSYAEVGRIMNISPRTVENHVAQGLLTCTQLMKEHETMAPKNNITILKAHREKKKHTRP